MKKIQMGALSVVVAMALVVFAGCSSGSSSVSSKAGKSGKSDTSGTSGKKVTLLVTEWTNPPAIKATKLIDKEFEKAHPNVKIHLEYAPTAQNAWSNLFKTTMASKTVDVAAQFAPGEYVPPAYMKLPLSGLQQYAKAGQLVNFKGKSFLKKDFIPGVQQKFAGFNGGIYGVTMASYASTGVFYNRKIFKKYGLSIPKTYNQFIHVCKVLKKNGVTPIYVGAKDGLQNMITGAFFQAAFPHKNMLKTQLALDKKLWTKQESFQSNPVWKKILQKYQTVSQYFEPNAFGVAQMNAPGQWASSSGKYAMLVDGSWDGETIHKANPKLDFGFFQIPGSNNPADDHLQVGGDFTWIVPTFAPHKQLAVEYVKFFSERKHYQQWEDIVGAVPTEKVSSKLPWMTEENKALASAREKIALQMPQNAGKMANVINDTSYLKPEGPDTIGQVLAKATQQFQSALPR